MLSRLIAHSATNRGYLVKTGETLGMAQRFGSVVSYVRIGLGVEPESPIFMQGEADYVLCMELIECLRNIGYLKKNEGYIILSQEYKPPMSLSLKMEPGISATKTLEELQRIVGERLCVVPAKKLAIKAGSSRAANSVILGVFVKISKILDDDSVKKAILSLLSEKAADISIRAYFYGKEWAENCERRV